MEENGNVMFTKIKEAEEVGNKKVHDAKNKAKEILDNINRETILKKYIKNAMDKIELYRQERNKTLKSTLSNLNEQYLNIVNKMDKIKNTKSVSIIQMLKEKLKFL